MKKNLKEWMKEMDEGTKNVLYLIIGALMVALFGFGDAANVGSF